MKRTASLKRVGLIAGALLVAVALMAIGTQRAAADDDVNLCPVGQPCINHISVDNLRENGRVTFQWSGEWERYNIALDSPGMATIKKGDIRHNPVHPNVNDLMLPAGAWNRTWTLSIQGCDSGGLFQRSDCTPQATMQITLRPPQAPENVRLAGNTVRWDRLDDQTFVASLRGTRRSDGKDVQISAEDFRAPGVRSLDIPAALRNDFTDIKACAENPGGRRCTSVPGGEAPPAPLPEKPATPTNFKGQRDGGFGTRIILSWSDTSNEEYYYLTAVSAQTGEHVSFPLSAPAPKLGANSTTFIDSGQITALVGGVEFHLQACNAGGCSTPAKAVVQ